MSPNLRSIGVCVALAACGSGGVPPGEVRPDARTGPLARAPDTETMGGERKAAMRDAGGRELGELTLRDAGGGVILSGTLRGIAPGRHAIHLHETGRCEPSFESAGRHWNPRQRQHGLRNPSGPHQGDLPNLVVGADSAVVVGGTTPGGTLGGLLDADGAAVVVHAAPDDDRTDPAGNSGDRIACGVISKD